MHYLFVTPVPFWPVNAGNRSLILAMIRKIKAAGHRISLLYSLQEDVTQEMCARMAREVDAMYLCPYDAPSHKDRIMEVSLRALHKQGDTNFGLDDWYEEPLSQMVEKIYAEDPFEVIVGNYIWTSKMYEVLPPSVINIQQTHDRMSDRLARMVEQGMTPSFFSVDPADEGRGLDRADINIAVQEQEEMFFRSLTDKIVHTLQFPVENLPFTARALPQGRKLRVGFIGSPNMLNIKTIMDLVVALDRMPQVADRIELHLVGNICAIFVQKPPFVVLHGCCDDLKPVYDSFDLAINPMPYGTGLKIKSVEALQFHCPIVMTQAASDGVMTPYRFHQCRNVIEAVGYLKLIADNPALLLLIQLAGEKVLYAYRRRFETAADALVAPQKLLATVAARKAASRDVACAGATLSFYEPGQGRTLSLPNETEIAFLKSQLRSGAVCLDLGSRYGEFASFALQSGTCGKVIAIEFDPDYTEQLKLNIFRNRLQDKTDLRLLGMAPSFAADFGWLESGHARSCVKTSEATQDAARSVVPCFVGDEFLSEEPRIDLIRVAVENVDTALQGLTLTIRKHAPLILISGNVNEAQLSDWAQQSGYVLQQKTASTLTFVPAAAQLGKVV